MNVIPLQGKSAPSLAELYRQGDAGVQQLFGDAHPAHIEDWKKRAQALDGLSDRRADRAALVAALRDYQRMLMPSEKVERSLADLEREDALVVVGGQQAGLFGGALLIVYKALTVIQAARHAACELGRPVVPVFWIAGEDHDFDEANHLFVSSGDGEPRRVRLNRPDGARHAVSRTSLSAVDWEVALTELALTLPDTEFKPELLNQIRRHSADSPSLTLAFARLLSEWFADEGLILLDADDPNLRALEGPMFRELIAKNIELGQSLAQGEHRVKALGFPIQAEAAPDGANLFLHTEQGRTLLFRRDDYFEDRKGELSLPADTLLAWSEETPDRFSNNALTRPLMQDYLLPVLATVLGPSEIAYWAVLEPAFQLFGLQLPIVVPRQSFTYVEPTVSKLLDKYKVTVKEIMHCGGQKKADWLAAQDQWDLDAQFAAVKAQFMQLYGPLINTVSAVDPGLSKLGESNRDQILDQITYLEQRTAGALAKRHEAALRQWDRMLQSLLPLDKPQERVLSCIHFLNRYGPSWLKALSPIPYDVTGGHRLIEVLHTFSNGKQEVVCK